MSETIHAVEAAPEERTEAYRVLRRDENTIESVTRWNEMQDGLVITAQYPYPNAERVGEAFGEGEYIIFSTETFPRVTLMTVVADKYFREKTDES